MVKNTKTTLHNCKYLFFRNFLLLSAWLPLRALHLLAKTWGSILFVFPNRAKSTTEKNLRACFPNLSEIEVAELTKSSLIHTASTAMEMGKSWLLPMDETLAMVVDIEGQDKFDAAYQSGNGIILLAPHLGNWEVFGFYLADSAVSTWLYQPPKSRAIDRLITETRSRGGISMAPTNRAGVTQVFKALRKGEVVGILPDQVPSKEGGVYASFFGVSAFTMTLVSKLLQKSDARVFCGFAKRLPRSCGYKVIVEEASSEIYSNDIGVSVEALNKSVEKNVEKAIAQYQWEYKRFKKQPDGKKFY
ncbi:MAG: hypothetical protein CMQ41_08395 [Gammaproteobacteria bacterium]|nr:hypothetical protein [Gammaproteobacteria bacterium]